MYANNVTKETLNEDVLKLCNMLDDDSENCVNLAESYIEYAIAILQGASSNDICKEMQICEEEWQWNVTHYLPFNFNTATI